MGTTRHRIVAPLAVIIAAPDNEIDSKRHGHRHRVLFPKRELLLLISLILFSCNLILHKNVVWMWRNRYIYVGCPEYSLWLRPHGQTNVRVLHLTGKFGAKKDTYKGAVDRHVSKIISSGVFRKDEIISYSSFPKFILEDPSWKKHMQFLQNENHESRLGAGYWFWKPVLIHYHLERMNEGDFLIYSDVDREDFVSWTPLLLETMTARGADFALEQMSFRENEWTKGDIYDQLCPELLPYYDPSFQYSANFIAIQKNDQTMALIHDWVKAASDYHLISDEKSNTLKFKKFQVNRHDQSLLSMLIRCSYDERGKTEFKQTCLGDWTAYTFRLKTDRDSAL
jgi:hypothetical protein